MTHQHPSGSINALLVERRLRKERSPGILIFRIYDDNNRQVFRGSVTEIGAWLEAGCPEQENER